MRAALVCALLCPSLPALADGPALAHLTVAGTTITLTETAPFGLGQPMTFAQMHLGFPLPPILRLTLDPEATAVLHLGLNETHGTSNGAGTPLGEEVFLWVEPHTARLTGDGAPYLIEVAAQSRRPLGQFTTLPLTVEVHLTSP